MTANKVIMITTKILNSLTFSKVKHNTKTILKIKNFISSLPDILQSGLFGWNLDS